MFCLYQVDEQMRQELAEWKLAVDKDKGGKTKGTAKVISEKQITIDKLYLSGRFGHSLS